MSLLSLPFDTLDDPLHALHERKELFSRAQQSGDEKAVARSMVALIETLIVAADVEEIPRSVAEAIDISEQMSDESLRACLTNRSAFALLAVGDATKALEFANQALQAAHKHDIKEEAAARYIMAVAFERASQHSKALSESLNAQKLFQQTGDKTWEASSLLLAAQAELELQNFSKSVQAAQAGLALFRECDHGKGSGYAIELVAQILVAKGEPMEALRFAQDQVRLSRENRDEDEEVGAMRAHVQVRVEMEDLQGALRAAEEAMRRLVVLGHSHSEAQLCLLLSQLYQVQARNEDAKAAAMQAVSIFQRLGDTEGEKASFKMLATMEGKVRESSYRTAALRTLDDAVEAVKRYDDDKFDKSIDDLLHVHQGFFTKEDFQMALDKAIVDNQKEALEFLSKRSLPDFVGKVKPSKNSQNDQKLRKRGQQGDYHWTYVTLRVGGLVYGPRYRLNEAVFLVQELDHRSVFNVLKNYVSSSEEWERQGQDLNPQVIDAGLHANFFMSTWQDS